MDDDVRAIGDVLARYCRGIDRRDAELVRSCYWPDATDDHAGAFSGARDEFVEWVVRVLTRFTATMHVLGTHTVEVVGDVAGAETYGVAHHRGDPPDDRRVNYTTGFRYLDRFERRDGQWRIAARRVELEWTRY